MRGPLEILFGNPDNEFLMVEILGRSSPNCTDFLDGNWLNARVVLSVGGFKGQIGGYLRAEEFLRFRGEIAKLNKTLCGEATFSTMEEWISFSLTGERRRGRWFRNNLFHKWACKDKRFASPISPSLSNTRGDDEGWQWQ